MRLNCVPPGKKEKEKKREEKRKGEKRKGKRIEKLNDNTIKEKKRKDFCNSRYS